MRDSTVAMGEWENGRRAGGEKGEGDSTPYAKMEVESNACRRKAGQVCTAGGFRVVEAAQMKESNVDKVVTGL